MKLFLSLALLTSVANASELQPGRCVVITEAGKQPRVTCNTPASERAKPCAIATMVATDGSIVTHYSCVVASR